MQGFRAQIQENLHAIGNGSSDIAHIVGPHIPPKRYDLAGNGAGTADCEYALLNNHSLLDYVVIPGARRTIQNRYSR